LALDEFQHFFDGKRLTESQRVSDWLKLLIETLQVPVVLAGLPRAMQVVNNNPQLRRRFAAPHYMEPFEFGTVDERKEFRAVLKGLSVGLPEGSTSPRSNSHSASTMRPTGSLTMPSSLWMTRSPGAAPGPADL
jgi:hypothetical protein